MGVCGTVILFPVTFLAMGGAILHAALLGWVMFTVSVSMMGMKIYDMHYGYQGVAFTSEVGGQSESQTMTWEELQTAAITGTSMDMYITPEIIEACVDAGPGANGAVWMAFVALFAAFVSSAACGDKKGRFVFALSALALLLYVIAQATWQPCADAISDAWGEGGELQDRINASQSNSGGGMATFFQLEVEAGIGAGQGFVYGQMFLTFVCVALGMMVGATPGAPKTQPVANAQMMAGQQMMMQQQMAMQQQQMMAMQQPQAQPVNVVVTNTNTN